MRAWKVVVPILLICSTALAIETQLPFKTIFKGQDQFNRLVSLAKSNDWKSLPIGERTAAVGQALTGTRYKSYTLEIDNRIESPSANFNGLDCWTFFETSLAFARMLNESEANGRRKTFCITSKSTDTAAVSAPVNIFRACIIWRTGSTTTTSAVWWKT